MRTFSQLSEFAALASEYQRLRVKHPLIRARDILSWIKCADESIGCSTIEQFVCCQQHVENDPAAAHWI
ncbi:hypothetical protein [Burkholderia multivorans]|uniref:hypothetical protein n=1 Tax=Burkholderia multivorans TaxID=87883 RepID=UPI001C21545A|nr:hypothetical protein [Burkholderia multivorans]MBU9366646.1 hypothetical protein [Burkholderia multivorans]